MNSPSTFRSAARPRSEAANPVDTRIPTSSVTSVVALMMVGMMFGGHQGHGSDDRSARAPEDAGSAPLEGRSPVKRHVHQPRRDDGRRLAVRRPHEWSTILTSCARANDWAGVRAGLTHPLRVAAVSSRNPTHPSVVGAGIASSCVVGNRHVYEDLVVVEPVDDAGRPVPAGTSIDHGRVRQSIKDAMAVAGAPQVAVRVETVDTISSTELGKLPRIRRATT